MVFQSLNVPQRKHDCGGWRELVIGLAQVAASGLLAVIAGTVQLKITQHQRHTLTSQGYQNQDIRPTTLLCRGAKVIVKILSYVICENGGSHRLRVEKGVLRSAGEGTQQKVKIADLQIDQLTRVQKHLLLRNTCCLITHVKK
ncbi:hypothetical protein EXN66_Car013094 [Channa argus]|uniref:Uncharacterized protein n=1 Tax=Channa argus TaxID=215402 RepID=A0A6G1Q4T3_CHAAH|nr:hypothetical protein EXN66_Car013094 [Channa argus]